jgi:hypothetical protein
VILGTDTSKWQPPGTYDPGQFEIINGEDPSMPLKVRRNILEGRPWGLYVWVYPGESGGSLVSRARAAIGRAGADPPLLTWWDYEQAGVTQAQLTDAFAVADLNGVRSGYYSNAHTVNHDEFRVRPYWLAAYPGNNDGTFPGVDRMRPPRPVTIWQYSSTNGQLDRNVIINEAWYAAHTGDDVLTDEDKKLLAGWMQEQAAATAARVERRIETLKGEIIQGNDGIVSEVEALLEGLPAAQGGGMTEERAREVIREELDRTKLAAE